MPDQAQQQGCDSPQRGNPPRSMLLDDIQEPGAYVCSRTGDLIRLTRAGSSLDEAELVEKHSSEPIYVTRISDDPFIPISRARVAAANLDVEVNF